MWLKTDNKIANEYWESKLKDLNYEKIQNDDYKLHDLIKDKYERKKYCDPKKTDPMTLIVQGKTLQKADDSFRDVEEDFVASRCFFVYFIKIKFLNKIKIWIKFYWLFILKKAMKTDPLIKKKEKIWASK